MTVTRLVAGLVLLAAVQACRLEAPFARTNPFDPDAALQLTLQGPDSVHAIAQRFLMEVQTADGPLADDLFVAWDSFERSVLPLAGGEFIVHLASAQYAPIHLSAVLDEVVVGRVVFVGQRAGSLAVSCSPPPAPVVPCDAPLAPGGTLDAWVLLYDANLRDVNDAPFALARAGNGVVSRDPAVAQATLVPASPQALHVRGVGAGGTWLVLTVDDAIDSLHVEVTP